MTMHTLNLARKWRSKTFDTVVGQDLAIKMLKNSLFTDHYFPVYLLAGQRGCGKTSTARIFAAAINCQALSTFQKDPKNTSLPCNTCPSCVALATGSHPDVIEIDAASHTGVDNVRMIVESSSLLPLMGRKKIYLIDEAHMLSKAAFNAFLKILEEPPRSVLFMLATTDPQKIIETVRSRCFQLFFGPVETTALANHLRFICEQESIAADDAALALIANETGGSVRDAINVLEQVRFATHPITAQSVHRVLGHLDDARLLQLFELVLHKGHAELLGALQSMKLETYSAEFLWQRWVSLVRASLWIKYGVSTPLFSEHRKQLEFLLRTVAVARLMSMLETFYANELVFGKTTAGYSFFEMMLLKLCQTQNNNNNSSIPISVAPSAPAVEDEAELDADEDDESDESEVQEEAAQAPSVQTSAAPTDLWKSFVAAAQKIEDPLLLSVFAQGTFVACDDVGNVITVQFPKELSFFENLFIESQALYQCIFKELCGKELRIQAEFSGASVLRPSLRSNELRRAGESSALSLPKGQDERKGGAIANKATMPVTVVSSVTQPAILRQASAAVPRTMADRQDERSSRQPWVKRYPIKQKTAPAVVREPIVDVSNAAQWPMASLLLKYFPGTVTQIQEKA